jgi:FkbM family methyltransferase
VSPPGSPPDPAIDHDSLIHKIGRPVTRLLLSPRLRRLRLARSLYAWMYLLGKTLAERRERRFLGEQVKPGMVVFDIGANIGFYTTLLARRVGPTGRIHAFEPDPVSFEILAGRVARHPNVTVTQAAAADRPGRVTLFCNRLNRADNRVYAHGGDIPLEAMAVSALTLDDYCEAHGIDRIDALKMDVQGAEVAALAGFRRTLARNPPRWMLIEFAPELLTRAGSSPEAFWRILDELGLEPWGFDQDGKAFRIADRAAFTREYEDGYTDVWAKSRGIEAQG